MRSLVAGSTFPGQPFRRPIRLGSAWFVPGIVLSAVLGLLMSLLVIAPDEWWAGPLLPPRDFRGQSLRSVLANFENADLLPYGSTWPDPVLGDRPVTVSLRHLPPVRLALDAVARSASVVIDVPWHSNCFGGGRIVGPLSVLPSSAATPPGVRLSPRYRFEDIGKATVPDA